MNEPSREIIFGNTQSPFAGNQRGVIPLAVVTVVAQRRLRPGQRVRVVDVLTDKTILVEATRFYSDSLGIIDPFIYILDTAFIAEGERVLCLLNPGSATDIHSTFKHPQLDK